MMTAILRGFLTFDWNARPVVAADWALAAASLAWGAWAGDPLWIAGGLLGAVFAWWRPMVKVQAALAASIKRRGA